MPVEDTPANAGRSARRTAFGTRGHVVAWGCAVGALLAALSPWYVAVQALPPSLRWIMGLAVHWQWAWLMMGLAGAACALWDRRFRAIAAVVIIAACWFVRLPAAPEADTSRPGPEFTVATANLNLDNRDPARLLAWLLSPQGPDVLVMHEFTPAFAMALEAAGAQALRDKYPHRAWRPLRDPFGIGLLSRSPIGEPQWVEPADALATLKLRLQIAVGDRTVALTAVHPMPPIAPQFVAARDDSLLDEARRLADSGMPGLLVGDFNDTPWSSGMRALSPLMRRASGLAPTWPNAWGFVSVLPLDHVLVTEGWSTVSSAVGPDTGSDHRPVVVVLHLDRPGTP